MSSSERDRQGGNRKESIGSVWAEVVGSIRVVLVALDDRALGEHDSFRDGVLKAAEADQFVSALNRLWEKRLSDRGLREVHDLLLMELKSFTSMVKATQETKPPKQDKKLLKRFLGIGRTAVGSLKDLSGSLPLYAKGVLTLVLELCDLGR